MSMLKPLPPWRRIPDDWRCFKCLAPASGFCAAKGVLVFHCPSHGQTAADWLIWDLGASGCDGYAVLRYGWRDWVRLSGPGLFSPYWHVHNWLRRIIRREPSRAKTEQILRSALGEPKPLPLHPDPEQEA